MCDPLGNVAGLTAQNVMFAKSGVVRHADSQRHVPERHYPATRDRDCSRDAGVTVVERTIRPAELLEADEIFSTGNHGKVIPCLRYESRTLEAGPMPIERPASSTRAFAHSRAAVAAASRA